MEQRQTEAYRRSFGESVGAGIGALAGSDKRYYILEHRTSSRYHHAGESQKIILNHVELGRDPRCQIRFEDSYTTVSRRHAAIVREGNGWKLVHLSKVNQTFLNGEEVRDQWYLENGDEIQLSTNGPRLGFIVPQAEKNMIRDINFTERFSLFRRQALKPYHQLVSILLIALLILVGGSVTWAVISQKQTNEMKQALAANSEDLGTANVALAQTLEGLDAANSALIDNREGIETANMALGQNQESLETVLFMQDSLGRQIKTSDAKLLKQQQQSTARWREAEEANHDAAVGLADVREDVRRLSRQQSALQERREAEARAVVIAAQAQAQAQANHPAASYTSCLPYIYYIQLNKIEILNAKGLVNTYNTTKTRWAGTGFLLNNGQFITSRRLLERWRFKENTDLLDLNRTLEAGNRVVAYFTAYSSSGSTLTFTNEQFTYDKTGDTYDGKQKVHFAPSYTDKDWAYFNAQKDGGLHANADKATGLDRGVNLSILAYPNEIGYNSASGPIFGSAVTTNKGLDRGLILTSNSSFEQSVLGAPVFASTASGGLEVVGLVSAFASGKRGIIVPISAVH